MLRKQEIPEKAQAEWKGPDETSTHRSANDVLGTVIEHLWQKVQSIIFTSHWEQIRAYGTYARIELSSAYADKILEPSLAPTYPSIAHDKLSRSLNSKVQAQERNKTTRVKAPKTSAKRRGNRAAPPPPPPQSTVNDQVTRERNVTEIDDATSIPRQPYEPATGFRGVNAVGGQNPLSTLAEVASSPMMRIESGRAMDFQTVNLTPGQIASRAGITSDQPPALATTPQAEGTEDECVDNTASLGAIGNPSESVEDTTSALSTTMADHSPDERDSEFNRGPNRRRVKDIVSPLTPVSSGAFKQK